MEIPNFIDVFPKAYSDKFCDEIIEKFNYLESIEGFEHKGSRFHVKNRQDDGDVSHEKQDKHFFFPGIDFELKQMNLKRSFGDEAKTFFDVFWNEIHPKWTQKYSILDSSASYGIYELKVQKTEPGQGYHVWHYENMHAQVANRIATFILYLNDDFEAGETEFLYQQERVNPEKGTFVIFPAGYTHVHRGNPPMKGTKYIVTGWIEYSSMDF